jgi:hypothetical protein
MELKTFKRLSDSKIALDGLIWDTNADKAIEITNNETGGKVHSVKVEGTYYFPCGIDTRKKK